MSGKRRRGAQQAPGFCEQKSSNCEVSEPDCELWPDVVPFDWVPVVVPLEEEVVPDEVVPDEVVSVEVVSVEVVSEEVLGAVDALEVVSPVDPDCVPVPVEPVVPDEEDESLVPSVVLLLPVADGGVLRHGQRGRRAGDLVGRDLRAAATGGGEGGGGEEDGDDRAPVERGRRGDGAREARWVHAQRGSAAIRRPQVGQSFRSFWASWSHQLQNRRFSTDHGKEERDGGTGSTWPTISIGSPLSRSR